MDKMQPIGVLDSGVGGLSVLKCLHQMLPHEDFIYVGDTARTPYGTRSEQEIRGFVGEIIDWLAAKNVKQVVIACNTLTMLGVDSLRGTHPFRVVGMSKGALATQFTIASGLHKKAILAADVQAQVYPVACPKFVPLIEGERFDSPELRQAVAEYTEPLKEAGVEAVILSCTHYPFIKEQIEADLGPKVKVLDPAAATSADAIAALKEEGLLRTEGKGHLQVCCTADLARVERLAGRMLPVDDCDFSLIDLKKN